jgi:DNA polymerase III delta prime subunit
MTDALPLPLPAHGRPVFSARREMMTWMELKVPAQQQAFALEIRRHVVCLRLMAGIAGLFHERGYFIDGEQTTQKWFDVVKTLPVFFDAAQTQEWEDNKPWKEAGWRLERKEAEAYEALLTGVRPADAYCGRDNWMHGVVEKVWKAWLSQTPVLTVGAVLHASAEHWSVWLDNQDIAAPEWATELHQLGVDLGLDGDTLDAWQRLERLLMPLGHMEGLEKLGKFMTWATSQDEALALRLTARALNIPETALFALLDPTSLPCAMGLLNPVEVQHGQAGLRKEHPHAQVEWPNGFHSQVWDNMLSRTALQGRFPFESLVTLVPDVQASDYTTLWGHLSPNATVLGRVLGEHKARFLVCSPDRREEGLFLAKLQEKTGLTLYCPVMEKRQMDVTTLWLALWAANLNPKGALVLRETDMDLREGADVLRRLLKLRRVPVLVCVDSEKAPTADLVNLFDHTMTLQDIPLAGRLAVAREIFPDASLALRVARSLRTVSDILEAHRWCNMSGETTWESIQGHQKPRQELLAGKSLVTVFDGDSTLPPLAPSPLYDGLMTRLTSIHHHPEQFEALGATPPKGALLIGPPGCGKTLFARHLAQRLGVPCLQANTVELAETPAGITEVFRMARAHAPCVLFFDEASKIIRTSSKTVDGILTELDGMQSLEGVMVIATTNPLDFPERIHPALCRPGRLSERHVIEKPLETERRDIWQAYLATRPVDGDVADMARQLARLSGTFTGADICEAVRQAAVSAAMSGETRLSLKGLVKSCDDLFWKQPSGQPFHPEVLERVAFHEAGHALLSWSMGQDVIRITVSPRNNALGMVLSLPDERNGPLSRPLVHQNVMMLLGGIAAEQVVFGSYDEGGGSDLASVTRQLRTSLTCNGLGRMGPLAAPTEGWSEQLRAQIESECGEWAHLAMQDAQAYLACNRDLLEALARALVEHRDISGDDLLAWKAKTEKALAPELHLPASGRAADPTPPPSPTPRPAGAARHVLHHTDGTLRNTGGDKNGA